MGGCCSNDSTKVDEHPKIPQEANEKEKIEKEKEKDEEKDKNTEEEKIEFKEEKFIKNIKIEEKNGIKIQKPDITLEVIHVNIIDSTMPASRKYIDEGNKLPFLYNTDIQTQGKGKGGRNWAGMIQGNLYTSTCIPTNMIKNELNNNDILVKITALSIYEQIVKGAAWHDCLIVLCPADHPDLGPCRRHLPERTVYDPAGNRGCPDHHRRIHHQQRF